MNETLQHRLGMLLLVVALPLTSGPAWADACKPNCGKVVAVQKTKQEGKGSGVGAVAGGVAGGLLGHQLGGGTGRTLFTIGGVAGGAFLGHQVEKKVRSKVVYKVNVQLDNGQQRSFSFDESSPYAVGDRVRVSNNRLQRYTGQ